MPRGHLSPLPPLLIHEKQSQWFDFKQALSNLEAPLTPNPKTQAWRGCALFHLYFHLSQEGQTINLHDLRELLQPYEEAIKAALYQDSQSLQKGVVAFKPYYTSLSPAQKATKPA